LREKEFPNRVFESMKRVVSQLEAGLPRMAANTQALRSLTAWPWIVSLNLKATKNKLPPGSRSMPPLRLDGILASQSARIAFLASHNRNSI